MKIHNILTTTTWLDVQFAMLTAPFSHG